MPKVVSVIPEIKSDDGPFHLTKGTRVLLDDGSYLEAVRKITLVAEVGEPWKAIIEVLPTNQEQIDAILAELEFKPDSNNRGSEFVLKFVEPPPLSKIKIG